MREKNISQMLVPPLQCWAQAGNFYPAIAWCDDLLGQAGLPDALRRRVESYVQHIRAWRARWYAELVTAGAGGEE